jgi:hypothetical protein
MKTISVVGPNFKWRWSGRYLPLLSVLGISLLLLVSCKTTYQNFPLAQSQDRPEIVIFRKSLRGYTAKIDIYQNGQFVGRLGAGNRYLAWQPKPGEVLLEARSGLRQVTYRIDIQPDKTYYLMASFGIGFFSNPVRLEEIHPDQVPDLAKMKKPKINYSK